MSSVWTVLRLSDSTGNHEAHRMYGPADSDKAWIKAESMSHFDLPSSGKVIAIWKGDFANSVITPEVLKNRC